MWSILLADEPVAGTYFQLHFPEIVTRRQKNGKDRANARPLSALRIAHSIVRKWAIVLKKSLVGFEPRLSLMGAEGAVPFRKVVVALALG